ncbi:hypothetical protein FHG66_04990 [Rubellimicrobium rubrum]|uniref:Uncharacterized protein n=1 Tax=Rubellimicrobium rubrum TaxID=2585369 RepID=A0A5C4N3G2_9RHOB|nr:hypothetical protein [Rubellimicrobium rubrum]TNC51525.1 hypothetical protein FHG66_04990 [Rubellimicrobium rubrum]
MTDADLEDLLSRSPVLFHMAEAGSWPSIRDKGLLSTSALVDLYGITGVARDRIEAERRPGPVVLDHPAQGRVVIRDNAPLNIRKLGRALPPDLPVEDWLRLLNGRVFFWLSRDRLGRLLGARLYREAAHDVLEVDAASLVAAHRARIELSPINSGVTDPFPAPRGPDTFRRIADYPYAEWQRKRGRNGEAAVELVVPGGVPDIADHIRRVVPMRGDREEGTLWERVASGRAGG